jgi:signal transduction histidine kinase
MNALSDITPEQNVTLLLNQLKNIVSSVMYAASANTLGEVLERIADASRELVGARYAALGVPDGAGGLQYFMFSGLDSHVVGQIGHLPEGRGLLGAIMKERRPIRLERIQDDPRSIGFPVHHPHMEKFLGVPIQVGEQLFGMLYLTDPVDGKPFDEQDQWLIETTAGYAALAIAGAQLREQRERLTLFEERERIGMELHDGVIQSLYAVGMQLELARTAGSIHPDDFIAPIQSLNQTIEDIRSYILDLHRHNTTSTTIISCLKSMTNRLHIPDMLKIEIDAPDTPISIPNVLFEAVCQMVNEAISNVIRHANATKVTISAYLANGHFYLTISDNGQGFDFDQQIALSTSELSEIGATGSGLGLRNIQRRARLHHGTVEIASTKGRGTQISLSLPISGS